MNIELDTHSHTIACNHAYSTITELAQVASEKGLKLISITEHGPELPGGPHVFFFSNIRVIPTELYGVKILKGIEANIKDFDGTLDLPKRLEDRMDIVLAGLHNGVYTPGSRAENTKAIINTMKKEIVDIVVHLGNPAYELNYEDILKAAKDTNTFIEINNSSFVHTRKGSTKNCRHIAEMCMKESIPISLGSDAHFSIDVGNFSNALQMLKDIGFPEELILNTSCEKLLRYLKGKGKKVLLDPRDNK